jgi:hypothetical protein
VAFRRTACWNEMVIISHNCCCDGIDASRA